MPESLRHKSTEISSASLMNLCVLNEEDSSSDHSINDYDEQSFTTFEQISSRLLQEKSPLTESSTPTIKDPEHSMRHLIQKEKEEIIESYVEVKRANTVRFLLRDKPTSFVRPKLSLFPKLGVSTSKLGDLKK